VRRIGYLERNAVPVILVREALGNREIVEAVIGIGIDAAIDHRGENRAGNGGGQPILRGEVVFRNLLACCFDGWRSGQLPSALNDPGILAEQLGMKLRCSQRLCGGLLNSALAAWVSGRILRALYPAWAKVCTGQWRDASS